MGHWGLVHAPDAIKPTDLDPFFLVRGFGKRAIRDSIGRRVVARFEFASVPAHQTKYSMLWLVLDPQGVDVCAKIPASQSTLFSEARSPISSGCTWNI